MSERVNMTREDGVKLLLALKPTMRFTDITKEDDSTYFFQALAGITLIHGSIFTNICNGYIGGHINIFNPNVEVPGRTVEFRANISNAGPDACDGMSEVISFFKQRVIDEYDPHKLTKDLFAAIARPINRPWYSRIAGWMRKL